jgi:hypothetical protein
MYQLDVEAVDLGPDVRAIGTAEEPWALDFFSHVERVRDFCQRHDIAFREASKRSIVIPAPQPDLLESLLERFQEETFGARAGAQLAATDAALEGDLARRGVDAYHTAFARYFFCAVCDFNEGSLVLLSEKLWASEVIRRVRPALSGLEVKVRLPA